MSLSNRLIIHPLVTRPLHSYAISTPWWAYIPATISALGTYRAHCHLCPTKYPFTPEWNKAPGDHLPCPRTQHQNHDVPALKGGVVDMTFLWKPCTNRVSNSRLLHNATLWPLWSSHCATSLALIYTNVPHFPMVTAEPSSHVNFRILTASSVALSIKQHYFLV